LVEVLSIFAGLLFAAFITALCDYKKESQILLLHDEINNATVTVYRGSFGNTSDIPVRELVVGDIVDVKQGDRVPADCLLVEEMNITVDESLYFKDKHGTGENMKVAKEPSEFYGP
jgi:P-type E1-E2 ATPase